MPDYVTREEVLEMIRTGNRTSKSKIKKVIQEEGWDLLNNHAGMYRYESTTDTDIQAANQWHLVNGFTTGDLGGGWLFHAGSQLALSAFATSDGGTKTLVTCAGHGLINTDVISIAGTTSYNGVWVVEQKTTDTFVIADAYVGDDGAQVGEHGSHYHSASEVSPGKYLANYSLSVTPATNNTVLKTAVFLGGTLQEKSASRTKTKLATDYQLAGGSCILDVSINGTVSLAVMNISDDSNYTIRDGNFTLVRIG